MSEYTKGTVRIAGRAVRPGQPIHLRHGGNKTFWVQGFDRDGVTVHVTNEYDLPLAVPRADIVDFATGFCSP